MAFSASSDTVNTQPNYPAHISEMQEIRAMLAAMTASPMQGLYTGMSVPPDQSPHTSLLSSFFSCLNLSSHMFSALGLSPLYCLPTVYLLTDIQ